VAYSGDSEHEDRLVTEAALLADDVKAVVATSALGMGFDKPDLAFVVHYQSPGSPIAYYQQVGRAGRGIDTSFGILLRGHEDTDIQDWFIRTAFPPEEQAGQVVALLEARAAPMSIQALEAEVNVRRSRIEAMLKVLEVEGAVERVESGWQRTLAPWSYDADRVSRVTALRRAEQQAMVDYARATSCRMSFLRAALDDPDPQPCGRCDVCTATSWHRPLAPALVAAAVAHVRSGYVGFEPRKRWPPGSVEPTGGIPPERQAEPGRALGLYGDGGWGTVVRRAKYGEHRYPDELVEAAARLVRSWAPDPAPTWLTFVPSSSSEDSSSGGAVADVVDRLAAALDLPSVACIRRARPGRPQKEMENSSQQVRNVYGAFEVMSPVPTGPVLLVDDIVDSRWTFTVVAALLREAGSGPVHPLALAQPVSS
jgi:ATP-dependent DNA helicase RecQ